MEASNLLSPALIETTYQRLGHRLGWRLLTCPGRNIESAIVALVTINPGGANFEPARWSVEEGSAYVIERWKGRPPGQETLQRQVRRMFEIMNVKPAEALSGYLVPFRSQSWGALSEKSNSIRFGVGLWHEIFRKTKAQIVIAFGKDIAPYLVELLKATNGTEYRAEWGDQTIDAYRFGGGRRLFVLPHLSRFTLFNRPKSEKAFRTALAGS